MPLPPPKTHMPIAEGVLLVTLRILVGKGYITEDEATVAYEEEKARHKWGKKKQDYREWD